MRIIFTAESPVCFKYQADSEPDEANCYYAHTIWVSSQTEESPSSEIYVNHI